MSSSENGSNRSSREIEREAEANRAQLSETLEELRERLSPGQLVDELLSGSRANVTGFVENLGASIRENPMPTLLIGAGLAMMMMGGATAASRSSSGEWRREDRRYGAVGRDDEERFGRDYSGGGSSLTERVGEMASDAGEYASDMARSARDTASGLVESASDTASSAAQRIREGVSSAAETVREYIPGLGSSGSQTGSYRSDYRSGYRGASSRSGQGAGWQGGGMMSDMRDNLSRLAHDQPLMVAAIGMAIGAGLGAALPRTRVENRYMGDTAEQLRDAATEAASQGYERAKDVASRTAQQVAEEARRQGLTPDTIAETARHAAEDMTDRVKAVADKARTSVTEGAREVGESLGVGEAGPAPSRPGESRTASSTPGTSTPSTSQPGGASPTPRTGGTV